MELHTQAIDTESVRREQRDGREWLVAPVVLVQAMELNGGYLPTREIERSANDWEGVPVTIDHPEHQGAPVSVDDDRADVPVVGQVEDPEAKDGGERLVGELWVDVQAAEAVGMEGERVIRRLENGDALEVSTGYIPGRVVAGQFDGEQRNRAVLDISPDHLATLPNDKGRCSIADGCGAGAPRAPAVNQLFVAAAADDPSQGEDSGEEYDDMTDDPSLNSDDLPPIDDDMTQSVGERVLNALGLGWNDDFDGDDGGGNETDVSSGDGPAESGADSDNPNPNDNMGEKTQELVENHDFDADNLPDEDTECFGRIYEAVANDDGSDDGSTETDEQTTTSTDGNGDGDGLDAVMNELQALREEMVTDDELDERLEANREREQRAELAADIVANTDDYDDVDAVLEDYPTEAALETKHNDVTTSPGANFAAQTGARASPSTNDAESFPSLTAAERARELDEEAD